MNLVYILLGSALGGLSRYLVMSLFPLTPLANLLIVNVGGSFIFGLLYSLIGTNEWRMLVFVGFLGSFTTLSTLSFEAFSLLQSSRYLLALLYAFGSLALSVCAVGVGMWVGKLS